MSKPSRFSYQFNNTEKPVPLEYDYIMEDRMSVLTDGQRKYAERIVKEYTGWDNLAHMCRNYPTLRVDRKGNSRAAKMERMRMQHLREFYAIITGRPAFGLEFLLEGL